MESKNMTALESTGASSEIKEQYEKHEKFVGTLFLFSKKKTCARRKMDMKKKWLRKN